MDGFVIVANVLFLLLLNVLPINDLHSGGNIACLDRLLEVELIPEGLLLAEVIGALNMFYPW